MFKPLFLFVSFLFCLGVFLYLVKCTCCWLCFRLSGCHTEAFPAWDPVFHDPTTGVFPPTLRFWVFCVIVTIFVGQNCFLESLSSTSLGSSSCYIRKIVKSGGFCSPVLSTWAKEVTEDGFLFQLYLNSSPTQSPQVKAEEGFLGLLSIPTLLKFIGKC